MDLSPSDRAKLIVQQYYKQALNKAIKTDKMIVSPLFSLANDVFRVSFENSTDLLVKIYHAALPQFTDNGLQTLLVKRLSQQRIYPQVYYTCEEYRIQIFVESIPIDRDTFGEVKLMTIAQKMADYSCRFKQFVQQYNENNKVRPKFTLKALQNTFSQIYSQKIKECPELVEQCNEDIAKVYGNKTVMSKLQQLLTQTEMVLSHNDCHLGNFLDDGSKLYILDYEFSQFNYIGFDLGNFFNEWATEYGSQFQIRQQLQLPQHLKQNMIKIYFQGIKKGYNFKSTIQEQIRFVKMGRVLSHLFWMSVGLKQINDKRIQFSMVKYVKRRQQQFNKWLRLLEDVPK